MDVSLAVGWPNVLLRFFTLYHLSIPLYVFPMHWLFEIGVIIESYLSYSRTCLFYFHASGVIQFA